MERLNEFISSEQDLNSNKQKIIKKLFGENVNHIRLPATKLRIAM